MGGYRVQQFPPFPRSTSRKKKDRRSIDRRTILEITFFFSLKETERERKRGRGVPLLTTIRMILYIYICVPEEDPRRRSFSPENHSHLCSPPPVIDSPRTCTDDTRSERSVKSTQLCLFLPHSRSWTERRRNEEGGGRKRDDPTDSITLMYIYMCIPADIRIAEGDPVSESRDLHSTPPVVETD